MRTRKEELAGNLYIATEYSAGVLCRSSAHARAERKKISSEGKKKINAMHRRWKLMQLLGCNFESGQDLFICLEYEDEVDEKEASLRLREFHKRAKKVWAKHEEPYKYICITETHSKDGDVCRLHHHLVLSGLPFPALAIITALWGNGAVDVRTLRELTDNFSDTCSYLLKERREAGKRAYSTSHNLEHPPDPVRRHVSDTDRLDTPPGVRMVSVDTRDTEFGGYAILIGRITDMYLFMGYWEKQKRNAKSNPVWKRKTKWTRHTC